MVAGSATPPDPPANRPAWLEPAAEGSFAETPHPEPAARQTIFDIVAVRIWPSGSPDAGHASFGQFSRASVRAEVAAVS
jgi:hypothetical protein